jgi:sodium-dependent dicarboxylate transporter 2/3/5
LNAMNKKQITGLVISIAILLGMFVLPVSEGLTAVGRNTIGLTIAFLILLMTEVFPPAVTCLIALTLLPLLGITDKFANSVGGFSHPVVFFILASFGISAGFTAVPLSKRILIKIMKAFGKDVKTMLLAIMVCSACVSSLISNIPTTAIFMAICLSFLNLFENSEEKSRTGRTFMIAVPVASMIGGMMTPAGSSLNLLAIGLLEKFSPGSTITFVQWMCVGIPLAVIMIPIAWFVIVKVYKPAEIDKNKVLSFIDQLEVPQQINGKEIKVIVITLAMLVLWILSSWISSIEVYVVALLGCSVMFMPGVGTLTWKGFVSSVSWEVLIITGTVLSMGNALVDNGVNQWLVDTFYPTGLTLPIFGIVALIASIVFLMLILIPIAPALITVLAGPLATIAASQGYAPEILFLTLALCASNCYLFPIDSVPLLTYGTGYYKMTDMPKSTSIIQISMIIILAVWLPVILNIIGLI